MHKTRIGWPYYCTFRASSTPDLSIRMKVNSFRAIPKYLFLVPPMSPSSCAISLSSAISSSLCSTKRKF